MIPSDESMPPLFWRRFLLALALGKAVVAGAAAGLATLGALDVAAAIAAKEWLTAVHHAYAFDAFAGVGGVLGLVWKAVSR